MRPEFLNRVSKMIMFRMLDVRRSPVYPSAMGKRNIRRCGWAAYQEGPSELTLRHEPHDHGHCTEEAGPCSALVADPG